MDNKGMLQAGFRYAYSLTHHNNDAEDLVQAAWVKLLSSYGNVGNKSLLFTCIRNLFIDNYRRNNLVVIESMEIVPECVDNKDHLNESLSRKDIGQALNILRTEEREAIFLNIVEGYSAQEIAQLTQRSRNTVLSLISRGKQKLRKRFGQENLTESHQEKGNIINK